MIKTILIKWIILTIAVGVTGWLLPELGLSNNIWALLMVSGVLGLLMAVLKPILMLLTCPLVVLTLGLFTLVINTFLLYMTAWLVNGSMTIANFWLALLASIFISIIAMVLNSLLGVE